MFDDPDWAPKQDMSLLCRVCANQHDYLIPIFEGEGLDHDMPTKMEKHLPIQVRENDKLPTQMCYQCASTIIAWSDLHTNCLEADKTLTRMLRINEKKSAEAAGLSLADDADDNDRNSDHYEDVYETGAGGGGTDEDGEDFEKEIKELISDAGVELSSSSSSSRRTTKQVKLTKPTATKPRASRKRKSETTTVVKRESKKSKHHWHKFSDTGSSSSVTAVTLLDPKEENVSANDKCMVWTCCKCNSKYTSWHQLNVHMLSHDVDLKTTDKRICWLCHNRIRSFHARIIIQSKLFYCELCNQVFTDKKVLEVHIKLKHRDLLYKDVTTWYRCDICCNKLYKQLSALTLHMRIIHNQSSVNKELSVVRNVEDTTRPCQVCGVLCVLSKYCNKHKNTEKLYPCKDCNKQLKSLGAFKYHMDYVHEKKDRGSSVCPVCGKLVKGCRGKLRVHMELHSEERRHICKVCGAGFKTSDGLYSHKFRHGDKQFTCSICGLTFRHPHLLGRHMFVHNERIYSCSFCARKFKSPYTMRNHEAVVHRTERPFECEVCGSTFPLKKELWRHQKKVNHRPS